MKMFKTLLAAAALATSLAAPAAIITAAPASAACAPGYEWDNYTRSCVPNDPCDSYWERHNGTCTWH